MEGKRDAPDSAKPSKEAKATIQTDGHDPNGDQGENHRRGESLSRFFERAEKPVVVVGGIVGIGFVLFTAWSTIQSLNLTQESLGAAKASNETASRALTETVKSNSLAAAAIAFDHRPWFTFKRTSDFRYEGDPDTSLIGSYLLTNAGTVPATHVRVFQSVMALDGDIAEGQSTNTLLPLDNDLHEVGPNDSFPVSLWTGCPDVSKHVYVVLEVQFTNPVNRSTHRQRMCAYIQFWGEGTPGEPQEVVGCDDEYAD